MKILRIKRKRSFVCCQMNYWIILKYAKSEFRLQDLQVHLDRHGFPIPSKDFHPNDYGTPIANGQELTFAMEDTMRSIFVVTVDGIASNELTLDPRQDEIAVTILTKGGWKVPGYPYLVMQDTKKSEADK
jgi:hypothetical protein